MHLHHRRYQLPDPSLLFLLPPTLPNVFPAVAANRQPSSLQSSPPLLQPLLLPSLPLPPCHCPPTHSLKHRPLPYALSHQLPLPSTSPSLLTTVVTSLLATIILNKKGTHLYCSHKKKKKKKKKSTTATLLFPFSLAAAAVVVVFIPTATYNSIVVAAFRYSA
ncbi:hypothetical protein GW17_00006952 [Ensete ventricosum]|nr:hypothetical protein GW17_00006952 [Ensete ventricosum]